MGTADPALPTSDRLIQTSKLRIKGQFYDLDLTTVDSIADDRYYHGLSMSLQPSTCLLSDTSMLEENQIILKLWHPC